MAEQDTDCALFVDDEMAKLIIAWKRTAHQFTENREAGIAKAMATSIGQCKSLITQAKSVGIILNDGTINPVADKLVRALIGKRISEFRN